MNVQSGARLPLFSAARDGRILGVKRIPQRDLGVPRFAYDEGLASLYGTPPDWPVPTRGVSEIRLKLRYRTQDSLLRHFKETSTLYLEIVDYPGGVAAGSADAGTGLPHLVAADENPAQR